MRRTTGIIMQNDKQDIKRKDTSTPLLSAINPKTGAIAAKDILNKNPLTDIIVALIFDEVFKLIWFLSIGVNTTLR